MTGIQHIVVSNRISKFKFDLYRNLTIVRGNSGTGKSTLYNMIADYTRLGAASGVNVMSSKPCVALVDIDWKNQLKRISDSIVFIDEGADYISKKEFAEAIKHSDNYYVIFNREGLHYLPYSVDEIYEIKTSGKEHSFIRMYSKEKGHIYRLKTSKKKFSYQTLLTEDSKSGLQFYKNHFKGTDVQCVSSKSNSSIFKWLNEHPEQTVLVIADGAAFGSEIDRVLKLQEASPDRIRICLPESFEWLILKSGIIKENKIAVILKETSNFVDSTKYFSWENFFEKYLVEVTLDTVFQYTKKTINSIYLIEENRNRIIAEIEDAINT